MTAYNGHKNWNHWNVALWINNDESLYRLAKDCVAEHKGRAAQAAAMRAILHEDGATRTPDGAPYSLSSIRAAMVEM